MSQWFPVPSQAAGRTPRWIRALRVIDAVLQEEPDLTKRLAAIVSEALAGEDLAPLSAEQWMRTLCVQQMSGLDDKDTEFFVNGSMTCRAFCGLVDVYVPLETLSNHLRRLDAGTWEQLVGELRPRMGRSWRAQYQKRVTW